MGESMADQDTVERIRAKQLEWMLEEMPRWQARWSGPLAHFELHYPVADTGIVVHGETPRECVARARALVRTIAMATGRDGASGAMYRLIEEVMGVREAWLLLEGHRPDLTAQIEMWRDQHPLREVEARHRRATEMSAEEQRRVLEEAAREGHRTAMEAWHAQHGPAAVPAAAVVPDRDAARAAGFEGDPCDECGQLTMVRNGACMKCAMCGATSGCS